MLIEFTCIIDLEETWRLYDTFLLNFTGVVVYKRRLKEEL